MKKVLRYLLMTVMALFVSLPCLSAEAASVALLPLINNIEGGDDIANQVFYKEALATMKLQKGFVLMENDKINAAIEAARIGDDVPDRATLAQIAKDGNVDIVIAMQIDETLTSRWDWVHEEFGRQVRIEIKRALKAKK